MKYRKENFSKEKFRVNERIKFSPVIVIDQNGDNLGKFHVEKAREFARRENLDLVEVSPNSRPPICKIMDFGKFKYEKSLKEKKQKNSKKQIQKEIRLSCNIAENDLNTKVNKAINFLKNNHKVQVKLEYKRRQNSHRELGFEVINKMIDKVAEFSSPVEKPKLEGNVLSCQFYPKI